MLHDNVFSQASDMTGSAMTGSALAQPVDRRGSHRVPFPAELLLIWHHDLRNSVRYRIIDASDGGFRISSSLPLLEGMTGMALKMLPEGSPIEHCVMIAWVRRRDEFNDYEIGLRYF